MKELVVLLCAFYLSTITLFSNSENFHFKSLTVQDGLSQKWVKCICKDNIGYLWVGTAYGLNKYDGSSIKSYKFEINNDKSLNSSNITSLFKDSKGNLWIGTQLGLNKYCRKTDNFYRVNSISSYVNSFLELENGNLIIGSPGGLFLYNPNIDSSWQVNANLNIESILKAGNQIWLGTRTGVYKYNVSSNSYTKYELTNTVTPIVKTMTIDNAGTIWIGTENIGLFSLKPNASDKDKYQITNYYSNPFDSRSIRKGTIYALSEDDNANLWIGVENGGINILSLKDDYERKPNFIHLEHSPYDNSSISNNSVHALYFDQQKTMWVGTYGNGISYTNPFQQKFLHIKHIPDSKDEISNNEVNAIFEDDKFLYIGTEGGLKVYDKLKKTFKYYINDPSNINSLGSNAVWSIFRDSKQNLWIGTWGGGLNLFNEKTHTFQRYTFNEKNSNSISGDNITKIIEDKKDNLWVATSGGGLNCFDFTSKSFKRYVADFKGNSISGNWVNDIVEDNNGNIWIATTDAVDMFNIQKNRFTRFVYNSSDSKSISSNGANTLVKDSNGNIWIGTSNGLNCFNFSDSAFKFYSESDGLPSNDIKAICQDNSRNLWISTNTGITKFINAIDLPLKPQFRNYTTGDGLQGTEFNLRACYKSHNGTIFFGGPNGYNVFRPDEIRDNPYIPNVVFANLLLFNKNISVNDKSGILNEAIGSIQELKLTRKQSVFTLEYAALNLIAPEKNQYAYKLDGFENEWNYVGQQKSVTYTNLDPGTYYFRVKASNNDGLWNEKGIKLKIIVLPAWWQTWYAKVIYLIIIVLSVYFFRKHTLISVNLKNQLWLEHQEKQRDEELGRLKLQFFTNISHELRTPLTLIIGPLKQLIDKETTSSQINTVYRNASRLKILVDQILDFSKIENQMMKNQWSEKDIIEVISASVGNFYDLAMSKEISLVITSSITKCICKTDEDKIDKIVTNIISNAIKNTLSGGKICIDILFDRKNNLLKLKISDTGQGIAPEDIKHIFDRFFTSSNISLIKPGTGIGLNLTHKLVEILGGTIHVESELGKGTTFFIQLPLHVIELEEGSKNLHLTEIKTVNEQNDIIEKEKELKFEKTVYIIDDNQEMCTYIGSLLSDNYNVIIECEPLMALKNLSQIMPDIIISDVMMPNMSGFELCTKIKSDLRFCHIPIILLTAKVTTEDQILGYDTGADDYIHKPFDSALLTARVKNLIAKKENIRRQFIGNDGVVNSKAEVNSLDISFIENIMEIVQENYSDANFNVNYIIERLGMSRSVFYRKFKALSNQSINDLITTFRLRKAEELLILNSLNISEIALECGFSDPAYFSKVFSNKYNVSPKEFKNHSNS